MSHPDKIDWNAPERRVPEILRVFHLDWDYLTTRKSLEIGAGKSYLGQLAKDAGVDVISVDANKNLADRQHKANEGPYMIANARLLPVADHTLDLVLSHGGPPAGERDEEKIRLLAAELRRVLKPGGEFRFHGRLNSELCGLKFPPREEVYGEAPGELGPRYEENEQLKGISNLRTGEILGRYFVVADMWQDRDADLPTYVLTMKQPA